MRLSRRLIDYMNMHFGIVATNNYINNPFGADSARLNEKMFQSSLLDSDLLLEIMDLSVLDFDLR